MDRPAVHYSPRAWVEDRAGYVADDWRYSERWPPRDARPAAFLPARRRDADTGRPGGAARGYTYDPRRPVPTLGGRNMLIDAGPRDQRPARALPDYGLVYRGETLADDLTIAGEVRATLHAGSDCPDTDFIVKLIEVWPDGRAMLLMDGVVRALYRDGNGPNGRPLEPGRVYQLHLSLAHLHHTVRKGHRLEVDVTSSNFPRRARNTNSGHALLANDVEADIRVAQNSIHHTAATPSFIEIPVLMEGVPDTTSQMERPDEASRIKAGHLRADDRIPVERRAREALRSSQARGNCGQRRAGQAPRRRGEVKVDGQPESRKAAKIRAGQTVECRGVMVVVR
jgi:putative CocE/NonD family hydrolase